MKELILVRHGESEQHVSDITGGWTDAQLTELGCAQAQATAKRLACMLKDHSLSLLSSDLARAAKTARIIGKGLGLEAEFHKGLREMNNGRAAGLTKGEAEAIALPITQPMIDWIPYPQAESCGMMTDRIFAVMEQIEGQIEETALIVSHGVAGVAVIQWWLGLDRNSRERISFELDTCSISWLSINEWGQKTIFKLNDTSHLES